MQRAVAVLQSSYLDSTSQDGFQYSRAILVENDLFLSEVRGKRDFLGAAHLWDRWFFNGSVVALPHRAPPLQFPALGMFQSNPSRE